MQEPSQFISEVVSSAVISDARSEKIVKFRELYEKNEKQFLCIHWLRRLGWSVCRLEVQRFAEIVKNINKIDSDILSLCGIAFTDLDLEDFLENNYFEAPIFLDTNKTTHNALNFGKKSCWSCFGMCNPMLYWRNYQAKKKGISGNLRGDGFQLGGTMIVDREGRIIFSHSQTGYTDYPDQEEIQRAILRARKKI